MKIFNKINMHVQPRHIQVLNTCLNSSVLLQNISWIQGYPSLPAKVTP